MWFPSSAPDWSPVIPGKILGPAHGDPPPRRCPSGRSSTWACFLIALLGKVTASLAFPPQSVPKDSPSLLLLSLAHVLFGGGFPLLEMNVVGTSRVECLLCLIFLSPA